MRFSTLNEWLEWQQTLHWQAIELGLERIQTVANRLALGRLAPHIITVAGTNGKGSTVAYYAAFLQAVGLSVGTYTSPHLLNYNERISINGQPASDDSIMQAFEKIDKARQGTSLSYFEFGTLAAFICMKQAAVDVAVLEVGLGGRLDAVNIIDADLIHFTPIGLDHTAWLGDTKELIAAEKAGVLRPNCQVICNDPSPPKNLVSAIKAHTENALYMNQDYTFDEKNNTALINQKNIYLGALSLQGRHQKQNCTGVLAGISALNKGKFFNEQKISDSLSCIHLLGRYQTHQQTARQKVIIDVGHNAEAAIVLAHQLSRQNVKRCVMILGMLDDKAVNVFAEEMAKVVDHCICIGLAGERGLAAKQLMAQITTKMMTLTEARSMSDAWDKAQGYLNADTSDETVSSQAAHDIILITGSFYTVEAYLTMYEQNKAQSHLLT